MTDRKEDGLQALGAKTEYRMDYAPEVLETALSSLPFALSQVSLTLQRFASAIFLM